MTGELRQGEGEGDKGQAVRGRLWDGTGKGQADGHPMGS